MKIQAGARCQLIRLWRRISPLLMFDVSPADSQAPLPHHPFILIHCTNKTGKQARVSADMEDFSSMYVWHLAGRGAGPVPGIQRSKLGAAWLREAKPDLARAFSPQYAGACPYNPCLTSIVLKCLLDGSRLRPRKLSAQKFADGDHFERESGDGWTPRF